VSDHLPCAFESSSTISPMIIVPTNPTTFSPPVMARSTSICHGRVQKPNEPVRYPVASKLAIRDTRCRSRLIAQTCCGSAATKHTDGTRETLTRGRANASTNESRLSAIPEYVDTFDGSTPSERKSVQYISAKISKSLSCIHVCTHRRL
jgi:hypothetical protein